MSTPKPQPKPANPAKFMGVAEVGVFTDEQGNLSYDLSELDTDFHCGAPVCCRGESLPYCGMRGDPHA